MKIRKLRIGEEVHQGDLVVSGGGEGDGYLKGSDCGNGVFVKENGWEFFRVEERAQRAEAAALRTNLDHADLDTRALRAELDTAYRTISRLSLALLDRSDSAK